MMFRESFDACPLPGYAAQRDRIIRAVTRPQPGLHTRFDVNSQSTPKRRSHLLSRP